MKEQFKVLRYILGALMLRRTKYMLMESGSLVLPPLTEITLLVHHYSYLSGVLHHVSLQPIEHIILKLYASCYAPVFKRPPRNYIMIAAKDRKQSKIFFHLYRMAPLAVLQKKVYISILRKELPRLVTIASGTSSHQSLQNIVCEFLHITVICSVCFTYIFKKL